MAFLAKSKEVHFREVLAGFVAKLARQVNLRPTSPIAKLLEVLAERLEIADAGIASLRRLADLDYHAAATSVSADLAEIALYSLPAGANTPIGESRGTGFITLVRASSSGVVPIPAGTMVAQTKADGVQYVYTTDAASQWADGSTTASGIAITATLAGSAPNAIPGAISTLLSTLGATVNSVSNTTAVIGVDAETPSELVQRIKDHRRSMSRVNKSAQFAIVRGVKADTGSRVKFCAASTDGPALPVILIDDGTGSCGVSATLAGETLVASAAGGEVELYTSRRPWSSAPVVYRNGVALAATAYTTVPAWGQIRLVTPLSASETLTTGSYSVYEGLVAAAQKALDGDAEDLVTYPPATAHGLVTTVRPATVASLTITGVLTARPGYDPAAEAAAAALRITAMTNGGDIGAAWYTSRAIAAAMDSPGVLKFTLTSPTADRYVLPSEVVRVASISIT